MMDLLQSAIVALLATTPAAVPRDAHGIAAVLASQEAELSTLTAAWERTRREERVMDVFPALVPGPGFFAPIQARVAWDGELVRFDFLASHTRMDGSGEELMPSRTEMSFDGERCFKRTDLDGEVTLTLRLPLDEIERDPAGLLYDANALYLCGWHVPRATEAGRQGLRSDLRARLAAGAALSEAGPLPVVTHASDGAELRLTLDPERGFAVIERELLRDGRRVQLARLNDHVRVGAESEAWLPRRIEVEHHQWYGLPPTPSEEVLFGDVFELTGFDSAPPDPGIFVVGGVDVGATVFDYTLPEVRGLADEHVLYEVPATQEQLDASLAALPRAGRAGLGPWITGACAGALCAILLRRRGEEGRR